MSQAVSRAHTALSQAPRSRYKVCITTQGPAARRVALTATRVAAHTAAWAQCCGKHWRRIVAELGRVAGRVVAHTGHVAGRVACAHCLVAGPPVTIQSLYHNTGPCCAPCRTHCNACRSAPAPCRRALLRRIAALLPCIATPNDRP